MDTLCPYSRPLDPILRGRQLGKLSGHRKGAGGQGIGFPSMTAAARRRKVRLPPFPPDGENCARFLAPPFQRKPASLGFALGAAFGGLIWDALLKAHLLGWWGSSAVQGDGVS